MTPSLPPPLPPPRGIGVPHRLHRMLHDYSADILQPIDVVFTCSTIDDNDGPKTGSFYGLYTLNSYRSSLESEQQQEHHNHYASPNEGNLFTFFIRARWRATYSSDGWSHQVQEQIHTKRQKKRRQRRWSRRSKTKMHRSERCRSEPDAHRSNANRRNSEKAERVEG